METDDSFVHFSRDDIEEVRKSRAIETIQQPTTDKSLEELKKAIDEELHDAAYRRELIRVELRKKAGLRRCYLALIMTYPARLNDIKEKTLGTRMTIYSHLYEMINLGIVKKISVMEIIMKKDKSDEDEQVLTKFNKWTANMNPGMQQYYSAKTNYFTLTPLGKESFMVEWALRKEKEIRAEKEEPKSD